MQGIIVFASVMATLGLQILLESVRQLLSKVCNFNLIGCSPLKAAQTVYNWLQALSKCITSSQQPLFFSLQSHMSKWMQHVRSMTIFLSIIRQMFVSNKERKTSLSSFIEICLERRGEGKRVWQKFQDSFSTYSYVIWIPFNDFTCYAIWQVTSIRWCRHF